MFAYCWPFPEHHILLCDFPELHIDEQCYRDAMTAYAVLLKTEADTIRNLLLLNNQQAEQEFYHSLVRQSIQLAVGRNARDNPHQIPGGHCLTRR